MAWFYTMFALVCWAFIIVGIMAELDQHEGIVPVLLFGIPAIIFTVIAGRVFHQYYEMCHDANPYTGLVGVDGKDIASTVGVKSLQMQHYDSDDHPGPITSTAFCSRLWLLQPYGFPFPPVRIFGGRTDRPYW